MIWYSLEYSIMYINFWLFNKNFIINLKEFTMDNINYLGWGSNFCIRPPTSYSIILSTVSMNTNQWERLSWKTAYAMILANNTKWVPSQLFVWGRAKLGLLERRHLHHMSIIELSIVLPVGQMDPHWFTRPSRCPELVTYQFVKQLVIHFNFLLTYFP